MTWGVKTWCEGPIGLLVVCLHNYLLRCELLPIWSSALYSYSLPLRCPSILLAAPLVLFKLSDSRLPSLEILESLVASLHVCKLV